MVMRMVVAIKMIIIMMVITLMVTMLMVTIVMVNFLLKPYVQVVNIMPWHCAHHHPPDDNHDQHPGGLDVLA